METSADASAFAAQSGMRPALRSRYFVERFLKECMYVTSVTSAYA